MILLLLLCVGLVLGGLLGSLAQEFPWSTLRFPRLRRVPALALTPYALIRLLASGPRGRVLPPVDIGSRTGPPGSIESLASGARHR